MRWMLLLLAAPVWGQRSDLEEIVKRAFEADVRNQEIARNYTYRERVEERKLDGKGAVKGVESKTFDVTFVYGEEYERLIEREDKPLSAKEAAKEQQKLDKAVEKRANESVKEREKRLEKARKEDEEVREMRAEIVRAFDFTLEGEEERDGVKCWRIRAEPRSGYEPELKRAKFLTKLRGGFWIAQDDYGWVRAEAETIEPAAFGLFLLKLKEGAQMQFEQRKVNDSVRLLYVTRRFVHTCNFCRVEKERDLLQFSVTDRSQIGKLLEHAGFAVAGEVTNEPFYPPDFPMAWRPFSLSANLEVWRSKTRIAWVDPDDLAAYVASPADYSFSP